MECPVDYSLCRQTVTVYHREDGQVSRLVVPGCFYSCEQHLDTQLSGQRRDVRFLLVMPGAPQRVFPGDRVYQGIGPEQVDWGKFLPGLVPGLAEAAYVHPWYWNGRLCHVEAGRK